MSTIKGGSRSSKSSTEQRASTTINTKSTHAGTILLLFFAATIIAYLQPPRANPYAERTLIEKIFAPQEKNEKMRLPLINNNINDLFILPNTQLAWAVGNGGLILHSKDGGDTWEQQQLPEQIMTRQNANPSPVEQKAAPATEQKTAKKITSPLEKRAINLTSISFANSRLGIAVGDHATLLRTEDGGQTWNSININRTDNFARVQFINEKKVFIQEDLNEQHFKADNKTNSRILMSEDAGLYWDAQEPEGCGLSFLGNVTFTNEYSGIATCLMGNTLLQTYDGGKTWQSSSPPSFAMIGFLKILPNNVLIASEYQIQGQNDGAIAISKDKGSYWTNIKKPHYDGYLTALDFFDADHGVAFISKTNTDNNSLFSITNSGQTWQKLPSDAALAFNHVKFLNEKTLIGIDRPGNISKSTNGGKNWRLIVARAIEGKQNGGYSRSPALWYWFFCLLIGAYAIWYFFRKPEESIEQEQTIADILASDRPLRPGDPDPLEFGAVARGLSRFMRNANTEPPLTLAITGAWGTGKSSLMNLLYQDLKDFGFTPVWFNAWHHQKGEQLLASLYANIRTQAIPNWFSFSRLIPVGFFFRINLLFRRGVKHWLTTLSILFLFTVAITFLFTHNEQLPNILQAFGKMLSSINDKNGANGDDITTNFFITLASLAGIGGPALLMLRTMTAFGLSPLKLITHSSGENNQQKIDPSARQQFAREFSDVAKCLSLGRIVIFIDDLDRCSKENVVDILETINFLSVSGDCYIVLGMDESWVKICVTQQFNEMAKDNPNFAEQYLEKMINIKIPVPVMSQDDSQKLLVTEVPATHKVINRFHRFCIKASSALLKHRHLIFVGFVVFAGIEIGNIIKPNEKHIAANEPARSVAQQTQTKETPSTQPVETSTSELFPIDSVISELRQGGQDTSHIDYLLPLIAGLLLIAGIVRYNMKLPERRPKDSEDFKQALHIWQPWILLNRQTPRAIKRYLNRVRYVAMRFRPETTEELLDFSRMVQRLLNKEKQLPQDDENQTPHFEANLVALNAIYNLEPSWVTNQQKFMAIQHHNIDSLVAEKFGGVPTNVPFADLVQALAKSIIEHDENFGFHNITETERIRFLEILAEI